MEDGAETINGEGEKRLIKRGGEVIRGGTLSYEVNAVGFNRFLWWERASPNFLPGRQVTTR